MLCLVTDRRRMRGADHSLDIARRRLLDLVAEAVDAGIGLVQVRELDLEGLALAELVAELLELTKGTATRVVVNERLDVALASGAHGVHLRSDSLAAADARRIAAAGFLIGRSVHAPHEAVEAGPVDYLLAGTVFSSQSKPRENRLLGVEGLRAIVSSARGRPVLAIGGITAQNVRQVADAGAAGIAAIGWFADGSPLRSVVAATDGVFDSANRPF